MLPLVAKLAHQLCHISSEILDTVMKLTKKGGELVSRKSMDFLIIFWMICDLLLSALPHGAKVIYTSWGI